MAAIVDQLKSSLEGQIDFQGQKSVELISQVGLAGSAVLAFILGLATGDLRVLLGAFGVGTLATLLVIVPSWPFLNKHPVAWRSPIPVFVDTKKTD